MPTVVVNRRFWTLLMPHVVVVDGPGHKMSPSVVVIGRRRGVMQSLVEFLLLFPAKFLTPEIVARILIPPTPHPNFSLNFRPLPGNFRTDPENFELTVGFVPTAFQNLPEDSRTLIDYFWVVMRPAQDIINVQSVVVNLRTLHSRLILQMRVMESYILVRPEEIQTRISRGERSARSVC
jgi:hypothetical protein